MPISASSAARAPSADEFEVSIFGPGKGEAVVVHLGGGDWITVDSCVEQRTGRNPVLDYFASIGVDPSTQVKLVVGTHAHDDHVAGISDLLAAMTSAKFVSSSALTSEEFLRSVQADQDIDAYVRQSVRREFSKIHEEVKRRGIESDGRGAWMRAFEQRLLWSRFGADDGLPAANVLALSPSDVAIRRSEHYLAEGLSNVGNRRRLSMSDPNEFAVALWVSFGDVPVLLGADLEAGPAGCGWQAVVNTHEPKVRASLHKVPHHGSRHAHYQPVYEKLLGNGLVSILAPFRNGSVALPAEADTKRLIALSDAVFSTADLNFPAATKAARRTSAALAGVVQNIREPQGLVGQVRARRPYRSASWAIDLVPPARRLR